MKVYYLLLPDPAISLAGFVSYIQSVAPNLAAYFPKKDGKVSFRLVREDGSQPGYDEAWQSKRVSIPLEALGIISNGRLCMQMKYHPPGRHQARESTDEAPISVAHQAQAEFLMWLERAPGVNIDQLPPLISSYAATKVLTDYAPDPALVALGAPSSISTPTNGGGMRLFKPVQPRLVFSRGERLQPVLEGAEPA